MYLLVELGCEVLSGRRKGLLLSATSQCWGWMAGRGKGGGGWDRDEN